MNRQKAEEKGIGREGSRHGQVKEIGRARKQAGQGKVRQGKGKATGEARH